MRLSLRVLVARLAYRLYGHSRERERRILRSLVRRLEGGEIRSPTLRRIFADYHGVEIGMYSHGGCFTVNQCDPRTSIGRYCSIAHGARILRGNHPMELKSMHGFFFDPALGVCDSFLGTFYPIAIGNDVWIGDGAIIMPSVSKIGDGAVIAAGAVVNKDIPPYAVVCGNPARVVRYRFSEGKIRELQESRWWEKTIEELLPELAEFQRPLEPPSENS